MSLAVLLQESGSEILLENGGFLLLEESGDADADADSRGWFKLKRHALAGVSGPGVVRAATGVRPVRIGAAAKAVFSPPPFAALAAAGPAQGRIGAIAKPSGQRRTHAVSAGNGVAATGAVAAPANVTAPLRPFAATDSHGVVFTVTAAIVGPPPARMIMGRFGGVAIGHDQVAAELDELLFLLDEIDT